jgi:hypothetical protein
MADSQAADIRAPRSLRDLFRTIRQWWTGNGRDVQRLQTGLERSEQRLQTAIKTSGDMLHRRNKQTEARLTKHAALLKAVHDQQAEILKLLGPRGLEGRVRDLEKTALKLQHATQAILRAQYLGNRELPMPQALLAKRFGILSQNDEDGIVLALFDRIGATNRRFVALGSGTNGGSTGMLAQDCGWAGLMVDASEARIDRIRDRFRQSPVVGHASWITRENVNDLLRQHGFTGEIDLLDIDVDGIDYWLWESIDAIAPRVVAVEFNANFGFERAVTVPYEPTFDRHRSGERRYYGASLRAFERLGARRGYRLVTIEPRGVNAFFVRHDVDPALPALELASTAPRPDWTISTHITKKDKAAGTMPGSGGSESLFDACERLHLPLVEV